MCCVQEKLIPKGEIKEELIDEIDLEVNNAKVGAAGDEGGTEDTSTGSGKPRKKAEKKKDTASVVIKQEALLDIETEISDKGSKAIKEEPKEGTKKKMKKIGKDREQAKTNLLGRPRRDSSSSNLSATVTTTQTPEAKSRVVKEEGGSGKKKEGGGGPKKEANKKIKEEKETMVVEEGGEGSDGGGSGKVGRPRKSGGLSSSKRMKKEEEEEAEEEECSSDLDSVGSGKKKNKDKVSEIG